MENTIVPLIYSLPQTLQIQIRWTSNCFTAAKSDEGKQAFYEPDELSNQISDEPDELSAELYDEPEKHDELRRT